jgi:hypothetical protein
MKTAMQELFMVLKEFNKDLYNTMYNEGILDTALEKEKEQIMDAYGYGIIDAVDDTIQGKEDYYNETFK